MLKNLWRPRALAVGGVAALALTLSACGGPSESAVHDALQKDMSKLMMGVPKAQQDKVTDCMTDLLMKQAKEDDLQAYADGDMKIDDVKVKEGGASAAQKCAKEAM
ncbi:hypothetical protein [Streptomyces sp. NBC_00470]|uniref:hypothetical protein n=1 Tax=Streptomyces sp. NBC_00470 TaxID=2975753 RepID=UPI002F911E61